MEYAKAGEATLQNFFWWVASEEATHRNSSFSMKLRPDGQKKKRKKIVDESHVNNVTRSVLDVEKNYRGFKI